MRSGRRVKANASDAQQRRASSEDECLEARASDDQPGGWEILCLVRE